MENNSLLESPRVLVVDDEPPIREILKFQLENAGFRVSCAPTGEDGLRMAEADPPDLVLLDLMMPKLDGYEVCRRLKQAYDTRHIPVIILTARGEMDQKLRGLQNGANDYVTKPFSMPELMVRVKNVLQWSQSQREANPLTGLPGNVSIERELGERIESGKPFAFLYTDIDNFKAYNDYYGYSRGDEAILNTARIISSAVQSRGVEEDFVGHIGGDDFVVMTTPERADPIAQELVATFDNAATEFFDAEDLERGYLEIRKRSGDVMQVNALGLTIAVVSSDFHPITHIGRVADVASELKRVGKAQNGSAIVHERRTQG